MFSCLSQPAGRVCLTMAIVSSRRNVIFCFVVQLIQTSNLLALKNFPWDDDMRSVCPYGSMVKSLQTRVVGGKDAVPGTFPYATGLIQHFYGTDSREWMGSMNNLPYCGSVLITDRHVLTAAHCVRDRSIEDISLDLGDYDITNRKETKNYIRSARSFIKHPSYVAKTFDNDIALIEFSKPVRLGPNLRTACLPPPEARLSPGTKVTVFGWGRLSYHGSRPHVLQALEMPVMSNTHCQEKLISNVTDNMLCAGGEEGRDACIGDSGSGLSVRIDNDYVLCGIVSFGKKCALPHVAGVYTRVSHYVDWIYEQTRRAGCRPCIIPKKDFSLM